jgi:hypothetical protein
VGLAKVCPSELHQKVEQEQSAAQAVPLTHQLDGSFDTHAGRETSSAEAMKDQMPEELEYGERVVT